MRQPLESVATRSPTRRNTNNTLGHRRVVSRATGVHNDFDKLGDSFQTMPDTDHTTVLQNLWLVAAISLGGGGFVGQVAGVLHGDLGIGAKALIALGTALIIFGCIYYLAPASAN